MILIYKIIFLFYFLKPLFLNIYITLENVCWYSFDEFTLPRSGFSVRSRLTLLWLWSNYCYVLHGYWGEQSHCSRKVIKSLYSAMLALTGSMWERRQDSISDGSWFWLQTRKYHSIRTSFRFYVVFVICPANSTLVTVKGWILRWFKKVTFYTRLNL